MAHFGEKLRALREQTRHPQTQKHLTQQELADGVEKKFGFQYSNVTISNWERNVSHIRQDERDLLINQIKPLPLAVEKVTVLPVH